MELALKRFYRGNDCTLGALLSPHDLIGYTLELPWKGNQRKISCIPAGFYSVERYSSPRFKEAFHLCAVPNRDSILIHMGNTVDDIEGCILVGNQLGELNGKKAVLQSKDMMDELIKAYPQGFYLTILEV